VLIGLMVKKTVTYVSHSRFLKRFQKQKGKRTPKNWCQEQQQESYKSRRVVWPDAPSHYALVCAADTIFAALFSLL